MPDSSGQPAQPPAPASTRAQAPLRQRIFCIHLPRLAVDRVRGALPESASRDATPADAPIVLVRTVGASRVVSSACPRAAESGVERGMTLAEAQMLAPSLLALDHEQHADRALLWRLADWAQAYTPSVEVVDPDTLLLDVTGTRRLFAIQNPESTIQNGTDDWRADRRLATQALGDLLRRGLQARAAVADTVGAAYALAAFGSQTLTIAAEGHTAAHLAPLPPASLRIDPRHAATLDALGVRTVGDLLMLPRASLRSRFGPGFLRRIEQALGEAPEPITPWRSVADAAAQTEFETPLRDQAVLRRVIDRLLDEVMHEVRRRTRALRRLVVLLEEESGGLTRIDVALARASRSTARVLALLHIRLERLALRSAGITGVRVVAVETVPWRGVQGDLFTPTPDEGDELLGELLDRLRQRLGRDSVSSAVRVDDHQPEFAFRYVEAGTQGAANSEPGAGNREQEMGGRAPAIQNPKSTIQDPNVRPLRLLPRPAEVRAQAADSYGPPTSFDWRGRHYAVAHARGPERIETAWWRGVDVRRDYFVLVCINGESLWVFRERTTNLWFIHGIFD